MCFSLGTSEGNVVGVILGKGLGCTIISTDGMSLGWPLGKLLEMWEGLLIGIPSGES